MAEINRVNGSIMEAWDQVNLMKFRKMMEESGNELHNLMEIDDDVLLRVIRRPQLNLHESIRVLKKIAKARFSHPYIEITENCYPGAVRHVFDKRIFGVLKQRDKLGRKVVWYKLSRWNPDEIFVHNVFRAASVLGWDLLSSKITQMKGVVGILEVASCSSMHLKLATPINMQIFLKLFLCNPFHIGGLLVVAPAIFSITLSLFKKFLPKKYRKLMHVHNKKTRLLEYVPANILPNFLGELLSEEDATDNIIIEYLLEKDKYYKKILQIGKQASSDFIHN